jgi:hypothetical protein
MADWQKYPAFWPRGLEDRIAALREALEVARGKHGHAVAVAAVALLELAEDSAATDDLQVKLNKFNSHWLQVYQHTLGLDGVEEFNRRMRRASIATFQCRPNIGS